MVTCMYLVELLLNAAGVQSQIQILPLLDYQIVFGLGEVAAPQLLNLRGIPKKQADVIDSFTRAS